MGRYSNKQTREPWEQDTMVVVHSATKGLAAMTLAIAHSRGWLDYEERVSRYWPEFAQQGKERITVRQLLVSLSVALYARIARSPGSLTCSPQLKRLRQPVFCELLSVSCPVGSRCTGSSVW